MGSEAMTSHRTLLLLVICLLGNAQVSCRSDSFVSTSLHSECIEQAIGSDKVVGSKVVDVDQDGNLDEVVVYEKDGDIYTLVTLVPSSAQCRVVLDSFCWETLFTCWSPSWGGVDVLTFVR